MIADIEEARPGSSAGFSRAVASAASASGVGRLLAALDLDSGGLGFGLRGITFGVATPPGRRHLGYPAREVRNEEAPPERGRAVRGVVRGRRGERRDRDREGARA